MKQQKVSRQPVRQPWTLKELAQGRALALANSVDKTTLQTYKSALNSWLAFVEIHHFPFEPTIDTLSFYIVFMSHHINPRSVKSYLSGIIQLLEPDYPAIRDIRSSNLVTKVMCGCLKMNTKAVTRKDALSLCNLQSISNRFLSSSSHDNLLFAALLSTGFHGLLRLGKLTFPDNPSLRDWRKVIRRRSLL